MSSFERLERQIAPLVLAALAGDASEAEWRSLEELLQSSPQAGKIAAEIASQEAFLVLGGRAVLAPAFDDCDAAPAPGTPLEALVHPVESAVEAELTQRFLREDLVELHSRGAGRAVRSPTAERLKLAIAFASGLAAALTGVFVAWTIRQPSVNQAPAGQMAASAAAPAAAPYMARFVNNNNCVWDPVASGPFAVGQEIDGGNALNLIEGLAEFELRWPQGGVSAVRMEGPASLVLIGSSGPILQFGKLTLTVNRYNGPIALETPLGRVEFRGQCRVGVSAFGTEVQVHCFDGEGAFESPWLDRSEQEIDQLRIRAGEAIRLSANRGGELAVERCLADHRAFVDQVSMSSDPLIVSRNYVDAVLGAQPLAYWRFESAEAGVVRNEAGPSLACQLLGSASLLGQEGSRCLSLGPEPTQRAAMMEGTFGAQLGDSYTIETWVKPSHFHGATILSLIGPPVGDSMYFPHGIALELGGSGKVPTASRHPGRLRFLHRNPMSHNPSLGTSCFSDEPYAMRRWQHLVAVKDGDAMRLYVDGRVVGVDSDASAAPQGLSLIVGRLYPLDGNDYPHFHVRPFVGQLDETAIYPRALPESEIREHYRLLRPQSATSNPSI